MNFQIRGKLDNGSSISGTTPAENAAMAVAKVNASLPEGRSFASLTVKAVDGGSFKIAAPRKKKDITPDFVTKTDSSVPAPKAKR